MNREWKRSYLNNMQQTETRIQMIKMVNKFKLTVVHFARPNPMQICGCAWIYRWTKKLWKIRTGPPGRGPWAFRPVTGCGPLGHGPAFSNTLFWALKRSGKNSVLVSETLDFEVLLMTLNSYFLYIYSIVILFIFSFKYVLKKKDTEI